MSSSSYPAIIDVTKSSFCGHKKTESGNTNLLEDGSINPVEMNSELLSNSNLPSIQPSRDGRRNIILKGVGGALLVILANLIILGNNVLIKEYMIDYVDMILLRSTVQLLILGTVIKIQGKLWQHFTHYLFFVLKHFIFLFTNKLPF